MGDFNTNATIVDNSLREIKKHGTDGFPFAMYLDDFSNFKNGYICWHWHDEVQLTFILEGEFTCQVNNDKVVMKPGDIVFINSCALHQICPCKKSFGKLYSFIWQADRIALSPESDAFTNCISPILNMQQKLLFFAADTNYNKQLKTALSRVTNLMTEKQKLYELRIYNQISKLWLDICDYISYTDSNDLSGATAASSYTSRIKDEERVKNALLYMQDNYNEDISLDDIAKAAMTSRSELCKSFKRTLDTSPKEFLIQYRIRQSTILLENPDLRISDISEMTGFSSPSHYGSAFLKHMGCTPLQYRKNL